MLEDPQQRIPPYDAIVMISPKRAKDNDLITILQPLVGAIPVRSMRQGNFMVDRPAGAVSPTAAGRWLDGRIATPVK